ncbi:hypothetical protein ACLKA7_016477 [Drosophila subpalustris]
MLMLMTAGVDKSQTQLSPLSSQCLQTRSGNNSANFVEITKRQQNRGTNTGKGIGNGKRQHWQRDWQQCERSGVCIVRALRISSQVCPDVGRCRGQTKALKVGAAGQRLRRDRNRD